MRGVIITVVAVAFYYAARLAWVYLAEFIRNSRRRHVALHVFWLTAGLLVNAGLAIATEVDRAGTNDGMMWKEWLRLQAHIAIAIGLRPLWREHLRRQDKGMERHDAVT